MVLSEREYQQVIAVLKHVFSKSPLSTILVFGSCVDVLDWFRVSDEFKQTIADKVVNLQSAMEQKTNV